MGGGHRLRITEISTRLEEALQVLTEVARFLVWLGLQRPERWRQIGRLIVAYNQVIETNKSQCPKSEQAG